MASCFYDYLAILDSEEEFEGFAREDITQAERNIEDCSGESDISESAAESEIESEAASDSWTFDVSPIDIIEFDECVGSSTVLLAEVKALDLFSLLFPEELIELIALETNRHAQQKQQKADIVDKNWHPNNK